MYHFFKPEYNPNNLTGQIGGNISPTVLSGYLGELFVHDDAPPSGTDLNTYQYRKVFIKNSYGSTSLSTRVWVDALEHNEQIALATGGALANTTTGAVEPAGVTNWSYASNYIEGLNLGTIANNGYTGIWIRQELTNITTPDPYATFRLVVGGLVT